MTNYLTETPWDKRNFNIDTYELTSISEEALKETVRTNGHFTVKVNPLDNPKRLLDFGFYYMDTLIEPVCRKGNLQVFERIGTSISSDYKRDELLEIAEEAFIHGRFHRDFNIPNHQADNRYMNWLKDLMDQDQVFALLYEDVTAGFYAFNNDKVLLMGMKEEFRSKGLAKAFVSQGCLKQFENGYNHLRTSISAANVASLNLFQALGFKLTNTVDVYHKLNDSAQVGG